LSGARYWAEASAERAAERRFLMGEIASRATPPVVALSGALDSQQRVDVAAPARIGTLMWFAAVAVLVFTAAAGGRWWWRTQVDPGPQPIVASLDWYARIADLTPITVTVGGAQNAPWQTTVDELQRNHWIWRLMHLENWNTVPALLREDVLTRMLAQYRQVLMNPRAWDRMTVSDWDEVPQPIRTVAYRQMTAFWAGFYDVGAPYALDPRQVRDTLQAIVMSESWFEHRARRVDFTGNQDIGLAQASDYARERVRQLAERGVLQVSFSDEDYWNPWKATRFLSVWMSLLLEETNGDLDRAVRAYNRGIGRADDEAGQAYQAAIERRRKRFIQNKDAPPAWTWLWQRTRDIEAEDWPWLHGAPEARPGSSP
jgi:hypothetical protein